MQAEFRGEHSSAKMETDSKDKQSWIYEQEESTTQIPLLPPKVKKKKEDLPRKTKSCAEKKLI